MNKVLSRLGVGALATAVVVAPLALPSVAFAAPGDPINIPSDRFLECLIDLGVDTDSSGDITEAEADAFTGALDCSTTTPWAYPSVNGIGFFQNVTHINLSGIGIQDLSGITGGTNNAGLDVDNPDAPSLASGALHTLVLSNNPLENLGFLNGFTNIQELNLSGNTVLEDLTPLSTLTGLERLNLSGAVEVEDLTPITSALTRLDLSDIPLAWDLSSLDVSALEWLDVSNTLIEDVSVLASAAALTEFNGSNTPLEDLTGLATSGVRYLLLDGAANLEDLYTLGAALGNIEELSINDTAVVDLTPLAGATSLEYLYAQGNGIEDVTPLAGLPLYYLNLSENLITTPSPLNSLSQLVVLDLAANPLVYDGFTVPQTVRSLNLTDTGLTNFASFGALPDLEGLYIAFNEIEDLGPLAAYTNLTELNFRGNHVTDVAPLADLPLTWVEGSEQTVSFPEVQATVAFTNTVRGVNGAAVPVALDGTDTGSVAADNASWTWTAVGLQTLAWNSVQTVNGVDFTFSGTADQNVVAYDAPTIRTGAFEMPWFGYMGLGALALALAAAFGFVAYRKRVTA